jgi:hypothetical protein
VRLEWKLPGPAESGGLRPGAAVSPSRLTVHYCCTCAPEPLTIRGERKRRSFKSNGPNGFQEPKISPGELASFRLGRVLTVASSQNPRGFESLMIHVFDVRNDRGRPLSRYGARISGAGPPTLGTVDSKPAALQVHPWPQVLE